MRKVVIFIALAALVAARSINDFDHNWAQLPEGLQSSQHPVPVSSISNRNEATPGQFPYHVALIVYIPSVGQTLRGASIISNNYILTAANGVIGAEGGRAILGAHNYMNNEPSQQSITFSPDGVTIHPEYRQTEFNSNDVATIRLNNAIIFNDRVLPIRIPTELESRTFAGLIGTISGFGTWQNEILSFSTNPIITNANCLSQWDNRADVIQRQNICLSGNAGQSTCNTDRGGPLVIQDGNGSLLIGIMSFQPRAGCAAGIPAVYARVSHFRQWIVENSDLDN
ncbi:brachyurin-like [Culex pipiens pallens]|uniref:brachyurin-like n=1 Tax=Culex pipiens pallens TaxID=42434 RepID=UPI001954EFFA|nr:brachyurin-like [Culex pipiens pallens]